MILDLTRAELEDAARLVHASVAATPQYCWPLLCERVGAEVWVKHENHTATGAFKIRGGLVMLDRLKRARPDLAGVISATRGNHGQSLAWAGRRLCDVRGRRKDGSKRFERGLYRLAERRGEAAGNRARRGHADPLAQDRAHGQFEPVERAGDARAGSGPRDQPERPRHLVGMIGKVHQRLDAREHGRQRPREQRRNGTAQRAGFLRDMPTSSQPSWSLPSAAIPTVRR